MDTEETTENSPVLPRKKHTHVFHKMRTIDVALWVTGCVRLHKDVDAFEGVFRPWHPVTWALLVLAVLPCALSGSRLLEVVSLRLNSFWRKNKDQLQSVAPWSRLDSLKAFNFPSGIK